MISFIMNELKFSRKEAEEFMMKYERKSSFMEDYILGNLYKVTVKLNMNQDNQEVIGDIKTLSKDKFVQLDDYTIVLYVSTKGKEEELQDFKFEIESILKNPEVGSYYCRCISTR